MSQLNYEETYPKTWSRLTSEIKSEIISGDIKADKISDFLKTKTGMLEDKEYISELARLEYEITKVQKASIDISEDLPAYTVNPSLTLLELSWRNLVGIFNKEENGDSPVKGQEIVIIWKGIKDGQLKIKKAMSEDLLALKLVVEGYDLKVVSRQMNRPIWFLKEIIERAIQQDMIIKPASRIKRPEEFFKSYKHIDRTHLISESFTLQWHITQACDLHCKHCYDRSDRKTLRFNDAIKILNEFYDFCEKMCVYGKISFSGGNPFLHPRFYDIYREAVDMGFSVAVLGNPVSRNKLEELLKIKKPYFYQVSLEGLRPYNDYIRGKGHFDRTIEFLKLLRELDIYSMVMLTLNRDNINQVIELTRELNGLVDSFTFNRLSMVGEGASLLLPDKELYIRFLEEYIRESKVHDFVMLKDNMFNIMLYERGESLFGGCTGFGCGAAFNFVSLLPDGEVHACRKFPSYIGNIFEEPLIDIYYSEKAEMFRSGPSECKGCRIKPVCGGCLAIAYSFGLDINVNKDPYCFIGKD